VTGCFLIAIENCDSLNSIGSLFQLFAVPAGASTASVTFYLNVGSEETTTTEMYDVMDVNLRTASPDALIEKLHTFSNLDKAPNGTYSFQTFSYDLTQYGSQELLLQFYATNDFSNVSTFRVDNVSLVVVVNPPPAPSGFSATATSSEITLSWNSVVAAAEYELQRAATSSGPWSDIGFAGQNVTTFLDDQASPGISYWYQMRATNLGGNSAWSAPISAALDYTPYVITVDASSVDFQSATLNSSINPRRVSASGFFQYGPSIPYAYITPITYGLTGTADQAYSAVVSGLTANTTYHFRVGSINVVGQAAYGDDVQFTTTPSPATPTVTTGAATSVASTSATLNGSLNPNGAPTTYYFQYGLTTAYGNKTASTAVGSGTIATSVAAGLTGLSPNNPYHFQLVAQNLSGSSSGGDRTFTTSITGAAPTAIIAGNLTPVTGNAVYYGDYSTGSGLTFAWMTSDGQSSTAEDPSFSFNSPGVYTISLTVTDVDQRSDTASISINVQASNNGTTFGVAVGADPVVLATGNYIQNRVDLRLPGIGFPFNFRRFYNSKFSDMTGLPLGFGWTFSYNERLSDSGTNVLVIQGDGSAWTFFPTNNGYIAEPGIYDSLARNADGTWTMIDKSQTVTAFDSGGRLASITDRNGNILTCTYSGGALSEIEDTAGRSILFSTNAFGCISTMTDPIGRTIQYLYDADTNLTEVIDANNNTNRFEYDVNHEMTDGFDGNGNRFVHNEYDPTTFVVVRQHDAYTNWTSFGYDFTNRITWQTNALSQVSAHFFNTQLLETNATDEAGSEEVSYYDDDKNRIYYRDKNENVTRYGYDSVGNVISKVDALTNETAIDYDAPNNPIIRVDALSNTNSFGYDAYGNLTSVTNALGFVTSVQYDTSGLPIVLTDARESSTTNYYDSQGNLVAVVNTFGFSNRFEYDGAGRKIRQIDALNRTNSLVYDNNDNVTNAVNALGYTNSYAYDGDNNRITATDPRPASVAYVYDLKNRLVAVLGPLNSTNGTVYDALDRKIATFDALGNETAFAYDNVGNLLAVTNALMQATQFTYDPQGNQTSIIDPTGHYITNEFDSLNRKVGTINVSISTNLTLYDPLGRVVARTNANGRVTQFRYDAAGRLTNVVDAANRSVAFEYDRNGNRIHVTDPNGHTWTNVFDPLNRLVEQDDPLGHRTLLFYDAVGNLTNKMTPNRDSIFYAYDALNRLTNIVYPNDLPVSFAYDSVGNLTNMVDVAGTTSWQYDLLNRLSSVTDPYGQAVANTFDAAGNRVALTYAGTNVVQYGFDALNRMTVLRNWLGGIVTYGYDARGNLISAANANGTAVSYAYDVADRLFAVTNTAPDATVIAAYALVLDGMGNHLQEAYDQPLLPILANQTNSYAYDSDNRMVSVDNAVVLHNSNGDLTAIGPNTYSYDAEDRLSELALTNNAASFLYDGLGNRLERTIDGRAERFVLDRLGSMTQVLVESDTNDAPIAYYVYGLGLAERITPSGQTATYHFNTQGSTVALTDSTGKINDSYAYDSFGVLANVGTNCPQPFRYLGRYGIVDDGIGLYYARARYFNPQLGRFFTKDSVASRAHDGQTLNRYVYALSNPLRLSDPSGLVATEGLNWQTSASTPAYLPGQLARASGFGGGSAIAFQVLNAGLILVQVGAGFFLAGPETILAAPLEFATEDAVLEDGEGITPAAARGPTVTQIIGQSAQAENSGPDFIVTPSAEVIPVPQGANGPYPTQNPGIQFNGGSGGNGLAGNVTDMRIMDPTTQYPGGYVNYGSLQENGGWQSVNPYTGQPISQSNPWWHIPIHL